MKPGQGRPPEGDIKLVIADLDGTLLAPDKQITRESARAVRELEEAGILFSVVSGRPPFGMRIHSDALKVRLPISGFNGGEITTPDFSTLKRLALPSETSRAVERFLSSKKLKFWIYRGSDWITMKIDSPHAETEARNVAFAPSIVPALEGIWDGLTKIVGISDDYEYLGQCEKEAQEVFRGKASAARSQPYYLDITHPHADKEVFVDYLSESLSIPRDQIATIGDMPSDLPMFRSCGLSIAMGNALGAVKSRAHHVTRSNAEEGFAFAMREFVLSDRYKNIRPDRDSESAA